MTFAAYTGHAGVCGGRRPGSHTARVMPGSSESLTVGSQHGQNQANRDWRGRTGRGVRSLTWELMSSLGGTRTPAFRSVDSARDVSDLGTRRPTCQDGSQPLASSFVVVRRHTAKIRPRQRWPDTLHSHGSDPVTRRLQRSKEQQMGRPGTDGRRPRTCVQQTQRGSRPHRKILPRLSPGPRVAECLRPIWIVAYLSFPCG